MPTALVLHFRTVTATTDCLASLVADGIRAVVLVDNSADGGRSLDRLFDAIEPLLSAGLALRVERPMRNLGFAAGVNLGLSSIRRHFGPSPVLLINSDATLEHGATPRLVDAIMSGAELATPVLLSPTGERSGVAYYHRVSGLILRKPVPGAIRHLSGCCLLISAKLASADLFNEAFFFYGEDAFLGWRMHRDGIEGVVVKEARVMHAGSGSSRKGSMFYEYHMARAHLLLARQLSRRSWEYGFLLVGRAVFLPLRAIWRSVRQRSTVPCMALWLAAIDAALGRLRDLTPPASAN